MNQNEQKKSLLNHVLDSFHRNAQEHQDTVNAHAEEFEGVSLFFESINFFLSEGMIDRCLYEARTLRNYFNTILVELITEE